MSRFDDVKNYVLYRVYRECYEPGAGNYDARDIERFMPFDVSQHIGIKAVESLIDDELLEGAVGSFAISARGITYVESKLSIDWAGIGKLAKEDRETGGLSLHVFGANAPASDRIVQLDHNSAEYKYASRALEQLEEEVRRDNKYGATEPEDRDQRLAEISAVRNLLKSVQVRVATILTLAVPTLMYLATKFTDAAIGKSASAVVEALKSLFGL